MFDFAQGVIQPIIVETLLTLILGAVAWFMRKLPKRMQMEIEARHREALHSAINTGVGLVIDTLQRHPSVAIPDAAITRVVGYVRNSVPDAIKYYTPSQAQIENMVRSYIQKELDAALRRDALTEALKKTGAL